MGGWFQFVGRAYYTIPGFIREASREGASRAVSLGILQKMSWGDRIWLAQGDMKTKRRVNDFKGAEVFGYFRIERIGGLSSEALEGLQEMSLGAISKVDDGGRLVKRGCGEYFTGPLFLVDFPLSELAQALTKLQRKGISVGKPLLQGRFTELSPRVLLPDVNFRHGFRPFNDTEFYSLWSQGRDSGTPLLVFKGNFNRNDNPSSPLPERTYIQEVRTYSLYKLYTTLAAQDAQVEYENGGRGSQG